MRPHVHVNCAMTLDGYVGGPGRTPLRISGEADIRRVHELRASCDAILVGVGTVIADDPKLTVKWGLLGRTGPQPLRVVLDPDLRTPSTALVRDARAPTLFLARAGTPAPPGLDVEHVAGRHASLDVGLALDRLGARGVRRLLVEGGPRTLRRFFEGDYVDVFTLYVAPTLIGDPGAPRLFEKGMDLSKRLALADATLAGQGLLLTWRRR